jgi:hypothetical protein
VGAIPPVLFFWTHLACHRSAKRDFAPNNLTGNFGRRELVICPNLRVPMRVSWFVALFLPAILATCTSALENPMTVFADPGKYEFHTCEQLARTTDRCQDPGGRAQTADEQSRAEHRRNAVAQIVSQGSGIVL